VIDAGKMLSCFPQSLCSWDFRVVGVSAGPAILTFDFFTEQGVLASGDDHFSVRKHGFLSGHWSLERGNDTCGDAKKPSAMFRSFDLRVGKFRFFVKAQSAFVRSYDILADEALVGTIRPAHAFTRRAFIECDSSVPELAQLFAFWLVALTWRRAANNQ
jgi:hypothetical protein